MIIISYFTIKLAHNENKYDCNFQIIDRKLIFYGDFSI